jgi:hypothetical protein
MSDLDCLCIKKIAVIEDIAEQGPEFFCTFFLYDG